MPRRFGYYVAAAMALGVAFGLALNGLLAPGAAKGWADNLSILTDVFLRLIRMIIAPLVFSTLTAGVARMEDAAAIGRVGLKAMACFVAASVISLALGFVMVEALTPGAGMALPHAAATGEVAAQAFTLKDFVGHLVPTSIADAMARNEILQIVVFSLFVGSAIAALEDRAPILLAAAEQLAAVMLKVTTYVMLFAPVAIFAALAATVATQGPTVLLSYAKFVGEFYLALVILWAAMLGAAALAVGRRTGPMLSAVEAPLLVAFSTASSEASYPLMLERLVAFGAPRRIVSFVLPLGYSFNLVGSMAYLSFATLFIAQAYQIHLSLAQQVGMLLFLMITSKGMAGVPRASIVVLAATLPYFGLPMGGVLLVLGVDHLLDMGRSATNVVGNSVAVVLVSRWEGALEDAPAPAPQPIPAPAAAEG
jgi:Na+/H+-dicarboxylate symporter